MPVEIREVESALESQKICPGDLIEISRRGMGGATIRGYRYFERFNVESGELWAVDEVKTYSDGRPRGQVGITGGYHRAGSISSIKKVERVIYTTEE